VTALLHVLATLVVAPYAALAVGFLAVGRVAASKGLWEILDVVFQSFVALMSWGIYAFAAVILLIAATGCISAARVAASIALAALAGLSLLILLFTARLRWTWANCCSWCRASRRSPSGSGAP